MYRGQQRQQQIEKNKRVGVKRPDKHKHRIGEYPGRKKDKNQMMNVQLPPKDETLSAMRSLVFRDFSYSSLVFAESRALSCRLLTTSCSSSSSSTQIFLHQMLNIFDPILVEAIKTYIYLHYSNQGNPQKPCAVHHHVSCWRAGADFLPCSDDKSGRCRHGIGFFSSSSFIDSWTHQQGCPEAYQATETGETWSLSAMVMTYLL